MSQFVFHLFVHSVLHSVVRVVFLTDLLSRVTFVRLDFDLLLLFLFLRLRVLASISLKWRQPAEEGQIIEKSVKVSATEEEANASAEDSIDEFIENDDMDDHIGVVQSLLSKTAEQFQAFSESGTTATEHCIRETRRACLQTLVLWTCCAKQSKVILLICLRPFWTHLTSMKVHSLTGVNPVEYIAI